LNKVILLLNLGTSFDSVLRITTIGAKVILPTIFPLPISKGRMKVGGGIG